MACPYFYPGEPLPDGRHEGQGRLPLGAAHKGICRAAEDEAFEPGDETLRSYCNFGYGRQVCPRFPGGSEADAIRFSLVSRPEEPARIIFVFERDFAPIRHGVIACGDWSAAEQVAGACAARQAEVFAANYGRKARCA